MNTIEKLQAALNAAREIGYELRMMHLDGETGGACEVRGRKQLFVDLSLSPREQLEQVLEGLSLAEEQATPRGTRKSPRPARAA